VGIGISSKNAGLQRTLRLIFWPLGMIQPDGTFAPGGTIAIAVLTAYRLGLEAAIVTCAVAGLITEFRPEYVRCTQCKLLWIPLILPDIQKRSSRCW
jgi:hypothetical protein